MFYDHALTMYLKGRLMRWQIRGGRPIAERLEFEEGWVLRVSGRAKFVAWSLFIEFLGFAWLGFTMPDYFATLMFGVMAVLMLYLVLYTYLYRAEVRPDALSIHRLLLPSRETRWDEMTGAHCDIEKTELCFGGPRGSLLKVSLTLNGLWTIRKSVVEKCRPPFDVRAWAETEVTLQELAPAWIEPVGETSSTLA